MSVKLEFSSYQFQGTDELCLKAGAEFLTQILLIPPLFDEMNKTRQMLCDVMRCLSKLEIGSVLPDLPGTNESIFPQEAANLSIWQTAMESLSQEYSIKNIASFRGGWLVVPDRDDLNSWQLSPVKGSSIITNTKSLEKTAQSEPILLAGNLLGPAMVDDLNTARSVTVDARIARLQNDSQPADVNLAGSPLWLRAEPDSDLILAEAIADDLALWAKT